MITDLIFCSHYKTIYINLSDELFINPEINFNVTLCDATVTPFLRAYDGYPFTSNTFKEKYLDTVFFEFKGKKFKLREIL